MTDTNMLAAICDATVVDEAIYFNDDRVEHGRAVFDNLTAAGYTVVPLSERPPVNPLREAVKALPFFPDGDGPRHGNATAFRDYQRRVLDLIDAASTPDEWDEKYEDERAAEHPPVDQLREAAKDAADYLRAIGAVTLADRIDAALDSPAAPRPVGCPECGGVGWHSERCASKWNAAAPRPEGLELRNPARLRREFASRIRAFRDPQAERLAIAVLDGTIAAIQPARLSDTGER